MRVVLAGVLIAIYALPPVVIGAAGQAVPLPLTMATCNAVITLVVMGLVERFARASWSIARRVAAGGICGATLGALVGLWLASHTDGQVALPRQPVVGFASSHLGVVLLSVATSVLALGTWWLAFGLPVAWERQRMHDLELENLRLEAAELRTSAELQRLRGQLEPHFLLNTLNTIAALIDTDGKTARAVLACLGDLLRDALEARSELHSIAEEVLWLRRYCEIFQARYGDLQIHWLVEPAATDAQIPRLLLQPLIENAVLHGALRRSPRGSVEVTITRTSPRELRCTIEDDGPGLAPPRSGAIGIENVRRRLCLARPGSTFALDARTGRTTAMLVIREGP